MSTDPGPSAEELFAEFVNRKSPDDEIDFDELFARYPERAPGLRELHSAWTGLAGLLRHLGVGTSLDQRLEERFGPEDRPSIALESEASSGSVVEQLDELAGRQAFGRYRIKDAVGMGGMGVVVRVWDADLKRHLAMKLTRQGQHSVASGADSRRLGRFLQEARLTAQLDHPCIVPVHELGLDPTGRVYFTMKLVTGRTLARAFEERSSGEGEWSTARLLSVLLRVCEAMSYAHTRRVVHRDLKPENVMIGEFGEVYVMDWGLAGVLDRPDPDAGVSAHVDGHSSPVQTREGDVIGTPAYMPPEQAHGELRGVGVHSDVYAIGAMLYELLSGHAPYLEPGSPVNRGEVWAEVRRRPPRPLGEVAPDAPEELVAISSKAMARDPAMRYADTVALARDLSNYLEGRVVAAYGGGAWTEARKWMRRNRGLATALAGAVLALVVGLVTSGLLYLRAERRADDVLRLSALQQVDDLLADADALWPPHPSEIDACAAWLARATDILAGLDAYRSRRDELRAELERVPSVRAQWWHEQLSRLISGLETLERDLVSPEAVTPAHGWSVGHRLAFARELQAASAPGGRDAARWERALPELEAAYPGLGLAPQTGLVPLGPDPRSGLWEFAHLMSGRPPERGPDGQLELEEDTGIVLVLLPGGRFWMGAQTGERDAPNYDPGARAYESPVHQVELSPFLIAKHELTQGQWERLTATRPSYYSAAPLVEGSTHPLEQVSWSDARSGLVRAGLELPSEAQWEYAARAGTTTPWWTGAQRETLAEAVAANLADSSAARYGVQWPGVNDWPELDDGFVVHAPAGTFAPNPFGLHEIVGNVLEWCLDGFFEDFYARSPGLDPIAPSAESPSRVLRGGSFTSIAWSSRSSARGDYPPSVADGNVGLRAARGIDP